MYVVLMNTIEYKDQKLPERNQIKDEDTKQNPHVWPSKLLISYRFAVSLDNQMSWITTIIGLDYTVRIPQTIYNISYYKTTQDLK